MCIFSVSLLLKHEKYWYTDTLKSVDKNFLKWNALKNEKYHLSVMQQTSNSK